jgi:hypothetical protein
MLFNKKKELKGKLIIDKEDFKAVSITFGEEPLLIGLGTPDKLKKEITGEISVKDASAEGSYKKEREFTWDYLYNPTVIPQLIPFERARDLASATTATVSGTEVVLGEFRGLKTSEDQKIWDDVLHGKIAENEVQKIKSLKKWGNEEEKS